VIRPSGSVNSEQVRLLLQRFRDLNLGPCGIDVAQGSRVVIEGCLSLDHPVELGVRYGVRDEAGHGHVLSILWDESQLDISLSDGDLPQAREVEHLDVDLGTDDLGRISAPLLGARLNVEQSDARDVEHFLRRIVRAVYSQAS
jgi:hypothetical protein